MNKERNKEDDKVELKDGIDTDLIVRCVGVGVLVEVVDFT